MNVRWPLVTLVSILGACTSSPPEGPPGPGPGADGGAVDGGSVDGATEGGASGDETGTGEGDDDVDGSDGDTGDEGGDDVDDSDAGESDAGEDDGEEESGGGEEEDGTDGGDEAGESGAEEEDSGEDDVGDSAGEDGDTGDSGDAGSDDGGDDTLFSFFVTSVETIRKQSGSEDGFGGNFGGVSGADAICQQAAADVGFGQKTWRAFLSATTDGAGGGAINAIDRIGEGPWYDRNQRLIAMDKTGLLQQRPAGDPQAIEDLADENGAPLSAWGDSHDLPTGSNTQGMLNSTDPGSTCNDWTDDADVPNMTIMGGHTFPRGFASNDGDRHWIAAHTLRGCAPGMNFEQDGPGSGNCIGCSGGFGGLYCFALEP